jgi:hypothetical protein
VRAIRRTCSVPACTNPVVSFDHFPTVVGYCLTHGNVVANFLTHIDGAGPGGFDGSRARWERTIHRRHDGVDA